MFSFKCQLGFSLDSPRKRVSTRNCLARSNWPGARLGVIVLTALKDTEDPTDCRQLLSGFETEGRRQSTRHACINSLSALGCATPCFKFLPHLSSSDGLYHGIVNQLNPIPLSCNQMNQNETKLDSLLKGTVM